MSTPRVVWSAMSRKARRRSPRSWAVNASWISCRAALRVMRSKSTLSFRCLWVRDRVASTTMAVTRLTRAKEVKDTKAMKKGASQGSAWMQRSATSGQPSRVMTTKQVIIALGITPNWSWKYSTSRYLLCFPKIPVRNTPHPAQTITMRMYPQTNMPEALRKPSKTSWASANRLMTRKTRTALKNWITLMTVRNIQWGVPPTTIKNVSITTSATAASSSRNMKKFVDKYLRMPLYRILE
mmetsp:Transcript_92472/g.247353  ORF Transcript_92472/g.247353 Transcript_92472/m.247353 type:complete len:239 (+) Transcript_92472:420-1136(+)